MITMTRFPIAPLLHFCICCTKSLKLGVSNCMLYVPLIVCLNKRCLCLMIYGKRSSANRVDKVLFESFLAERCLQVVLNFTKCLEHLESSIFKRKHLIFGVKENEFNRKDPIGIKWDAHRFLF